HVRGGYARPYGGPNMWVSEPGSEAPQPRSELTWSSPQTGRHGDVIVDDDVHEDLINLHHHRTEAESMPTLVRNGRLETQVGGTGRVLARVEESRRRRWSVDVGPAQQSENLRLVVEDTNGADEARVVAIRAYSA